VRRVAGFRDAPGRDHLGEDTVLEAIDQPFHLARADVGA
jgi:hypothetical protein